MRSICRPLAEAEPTHRLLETLHRQAWELGAGAQGRMLKLGCWRAPPGCSLCLWGGWTHRDATAAPSQWHLDGRGMLLLQQSSHR